MNFIELNRDNYNRPTKEWLSDFLYEVRNCEEVRIQLINSLPIEKYLHIDWINNTYNLTPSKCVYIVEHNRVLIGYCDVDYHNMDHIICETQAEIGFKLHSHEQGKGQGKIMIREFINYLLKMNKNLVKLWLTVLVTNDKALHIYTDIGFHYAMTKFVNYKAVNYYELEIQHGKVY